MARSLSSESTSLKKGCPPLKETKVKRQNPGRILSGNSQEQESYFARAEAPMCFPASGIEALPTAFNVGARGTLQYLVGNQPHADGQTDRSTGRGESERVRAPGIYRRRQPKARRTRAWISQDGFLAMYLPGASGPMCPQGRP